MTITVVGGFGVGKTIQTRRAPEAGETVTGGFYSEGPGGKGSNQAVQISRLGTAANLITSIGDDAAGAMGRRLWADEGVGTEGIVTLDAPTMVGFIIVDDRGENRIALAPGALDRMTTAELEPLRGIIESSRCLVVSFELNPAVGIQALEWAHRAGVRTLCNPAPAIELTPAQLGTCDVIVPNYREACQLLGVSPGEHPSPEDVARGLVALGARSIVITLGAQGAYVLEGGIGSHIDPAPVDHVVDTTGAGDSFVGALAVALDRGESLVEAAEFAATVAALSVTTAEVIPSLPRRGDTRLRLKERA